jgi:hypothetical protein
MDALVGVEEADIAREQPVALWVGDRDALPVPAIEPIEPMPTAEARKQCRSYLVC